MTSGLALHVEASKLSDGGGGGLGVRDRNGKASTHEPFATQGGNTGFGNDGISRRVHVQGRETGGAGG